MFLTVLHKDYDILPGTPLSLEDTSEETKIQHNFSDHTGGPLPPIHGTNQEHVLL